MPIILPKELKTLEMEPEDKLQLVADLQELYLDSKHLLSHSRDSGNDLWLLCIAIIQGSYVRWPGRKSILNLLRKDHKDLWARVRPFIVINEAPNVPYDRETAGRMGVHDLVNYVSQYIIPRSLSYDYWPGRENRRER